jgi:hypothetical protein
MRPPLIVRLLLAVVALAVAVSLAALERDHDRCETASTRAFLASQAPAPLLDRRLDAVIADCAGAEPLARIAVGLHVDRPRPAARLARVAAQREPDSYAAWGVLAATGRPAEARAAAERARALNPLSVAASP